jgi:hypothetical protein
LCPATKVEIYAPRGSYKLYISGIAYDFSCGATKYEGKVLTLQVITVVKDNLPGLLLTERSILGQSSRVSWILVTPNDDSTTFHYAQLLSSAQIVSEVILDKHHGIYAAMNQAISSADSEDWLWFLNAGDEFADTNTYQLVNQCAQKSINNWLYGGYFLGSQSGNILGEFKAPKKFKASNQLFAKEYISHQSTIFRAKFLKDLGGFNVKLQIAADWDLMVRASKLDPGISIGKTVSIFYLGGMSTKARQIANVELLQLRKKYLGRRLILRNYSFFFYRFFRNYLVLTLEAIVPDIVNFIRKLKFKYR